MRRHLALLLVAAVPLLLANGTTSKESASIAAKVQKAYEGAKDLQANFTQQTTIQSGARSGPKSTGTLYLKKPGKLRWEFDEAATFVSDGSTLWTYDPEENQVIVNRFMRETTSMTALNFLGGMGGLTDSFDVKIVPPKGEPADRGAFLLLTPKDEADVQIQQLVLVVSKKTWLASEAYLTDPYGNETHLVFNSVKVNSGLKDEMFVFKIPEGADVIEPSLLAPRPKEPAPKATAPAPPKK